MCKADCFGAGSGENATTMLSPWCMHCGDKDDDERTVTTKWQAIRNRPEVMCLQLKRFNQVRHSSIHHPSLSCRCNHHQLHVLASELGVTEV